MTLSAQAVIDETGKYRYSLIREWDPAGPRVLFIMLNPSTADATQDDPTIRRCIRFAKRWGYGSLEVCNLFAYRATDPKELIKAEDPVGPENDKYIYEAVGRARLVIAAWGTKGAMGRRSNEVITLLLRTKLYCLEVTKHGHPKHPLYVRGETMPKFFRSIRKVVNQ